MALEHISKIANEIGEIVKEREKEILAEEESEKRKLEEEKRKKEIARLGGLRAYEDFTLEKFTNKKAIELCKDYPGCNLYIFGPGGSGKTHLAVAVGRKVPEFRLVKAMHIFREIIDCEKKLWQEEIIKKYATGCILIDDLGVEKSSEWAMSVLYEILDKRWMEKKNGLIITSNFSLPELNEKIGNDRLSTRIAGMCKIIKLEGRDRRIK